jgi:CheY-like chemotaxis protein
LMDIQMPELDGLDAIRIVRQQETETGRHLPIIALTAHAMTGDKERCLKAGADGYLSKPLQRGELLAIVEKHIAKLQADTASESHRSARFTVPV